MGGRLLDHVGAAAELRAAEDVSTPDDDRQLNAPRRDPRGLAGDPADLFDADAPFARPAEALAGELEQHAAEDRRTGRDGGVHEVRILWGFAKFGDRIRGQP